MTTPAEIADLLRETHFLDGFTDAHLWKLSRHVTPRDLVADETIFNEGEPRQRFAILVSGAVAIEKAADGRSTRLVTLGPGEAVGEGLLLDDSNHGTTARVIMPGKAMLLTRTQIEDITREAPQLYAALVAKARGPFPNACAAPMPHWSDVDARWASAGIARASSTICSANAKCRTKRCMVSRHCGPSRTSPSPAFRCASSRC